MASTAPASAFARVAQLAADRRIHQAFQWMHLHEQQILRWQTELVSVLLKYSDLMEPAGKYAFPSTSTMSSLSATTTLFQLAR